MKYPTTQEINNADRLQICRWYRFLPDSANVDEENIILYVMTRFRALGGMTPEISKQIGW